MIVNDKDAVARLSSPMNLINHLKSDKHTKRNNAMALFGIGRKSLTNTETDKIVDAGFDKPSFDSFHHSASQTSQVPTETTLDNILENHDAQIKLGLAHDSALKLLNSSIEQLSAKLDDVRADKLPAVISAASKTVESIRKERVEASKNGKDREVHYHFYTPEQKKLSEYEVIDVG